MARVDREAVLAPSSSPEEVEETFRRLDLHPAGFAHEVTVHLGREVVDGGAVSEVGVDDEAKPFELLEVPIDSGQIHIGGERLDFGGQVFGGAMGSATEQTAEKEPA